MRSANHSRLDTRRRSRTEPSRAPQRMGRTPPERCPVILALAVAVGLTWVPPGLAQSTAPAPMAPPPAGKDQSAVPLRGHLRQRFSFSCEPGQDVSASVWGTDVYSDESRICAAAVHAGVITRSSGGTVTIEIRPSLDHGPGSSRNGVTSAPFWNAPGTYVFVRS